MILAAAEQDYDRFYDDEIRLRRLRRDPPFADHFTLTVTGPEEEPVRRACVQLCAALRQALSQESYRAMEPEVLGPAPAPVVKLNNRYRYRITVVGQNEKTAPSAAGGLYEGLRPPPGASQYGGPHGLQSDGLEVRRIWL